LIGRNSALRTVMGLEPTMLVTKSRHKSLS
jgi:hypothetical protein